MHLPTPRFLAAWVAVIALTATACAASEAVSVPTTTASTTTTATSATTTTAAQTATRTTTTSTAPTTTAATTTTTTTTTTTSTTEPPRRALFLGFAGDTSFTDGLDRRDPLSRVAHLLSLPDLMFVNLETAVAEPGVGRAANKTYTFKSPPESLALLTEAGIDGVALANNHTLDFGRDALLRTLELVDEAGLLRVGAGPDPGTAYAPLVVEIADSTVAVLSFSRIPCGWSGSGENTRPEVAWACDPFVDDTVAAVEGAAADADVTVVMVHWGIELDRCPQPYQRDLANRWAEAGADIVVGSHPHILQGVERIGDTWVLHSTANFAFPPARLERAESAIFGFIIDPGNDIALRAIPVMVPGGVARPADEPQTQSILGKLTRYSFGWEFDTDGFARPTETIGACGA